MRIPHVYDRATLIFTVVPTFGALPLQGVSTFGASNQPATPPLVVGYNRNQHLSIENERWKCLAQSPRCLEMADGKS